MKSHWQEDASLIDTYSDLEQAALNGSLRPVVFIIATTRKFDLIGFERSLKSSLNSSNLRLCSDLIHLFIGYDKFLPSETEFEFLNVKKFTMDTEKFQTNNIGVTRRFQRELAVMACSMLDDPILIMMDDDMRFEAAYLSNGKVDIGYPFSYVHEVYKFGERYTCDIALGGVTGAPPLPATSSMRTFLQDFLSCAANNCSEGRWKASDYYYDLSETRTNWDAWQIIEKPGKEDNNANFFLNQIFFSGSKNRPLVITELPTDQVPTKTIVRGGNTVVYNPSYITDIQHPKMSRRGDSIWSILAKQKGATILQFPAPLYHDRDYGDYDLVSLQKRMIDDLFGASLQRAMLEDLHSFERILKNRCEQQKLLINECLSLIKRAQDTFPKKLQSNGTLWGLSKKERDKFLFTCKNVLSSLEDCLANYIGKISDNVEYGTMLAKSLRYDLEEVVI